MTTTAADDEPTNPDDNEHTHTAPPPAYRPTLVITNADDADADTPVVSTNNDYNNNHNAADNV